MSPIKSDKIGKSTLPRTELKSPSASDAAVPSDPSTASGWGVRQKGASGFEPSRVAGAAPAPLQLLPEASATVRGVRTPVAARLAKVEVQDQGTLYELAVDCPAGVESFEVALTLPSFTVASITRDGWNSFSGRPGNEDLVGRREGKTAFTNYEKRVFFVEPRNVVPDPKAGASYGWAMLHRTSGDDAFVGTIPSFVGSDELRFSQAGADLQLKVIRHLGGAERKAETTSVKVWVGHGPLSEQTRSYSHALGALSSLEPMKKLIIGCSWPTHGKRITQAALESELAGSADVLAHNAYVIDDGWQKAIGDWDIDTTRFPDLKGWASRAEAMGIEPGIWIAPFMISKYSETFRDHPEWIMQDDHGDVARASNYQVLPTGGPWPMIERCAGLDISLPEVREHLTQVFLGLAEQGFKIFKVDFLAVPFMGELKQGKHTVVEHYRRFFLDLRARLEAGGHPARFIGCGAPMMESIGLFEGMRISPDSTAPPFEQMAPVAGLVDALKKIPGVEGALTHSEQAHNDKMYGNAMRVAKVRAPIFDQAYGLAIDGVVLGDHNAELNPMIRDSANHLLDGLLRSSENVNIFVADPLSRLDAEGKERWRGLQAKLTGSP